MLRVGADGRPDVEHDQFAAHRRPDRRDRRALDRRHRVQAEFRHRHQGAGVAGGDRAIGRARFHRLDRLPHRRDAPPAAQRLARPVGHLDRDVGVKEARFPGQPGMALKEGPNRRLLAKQQKRDVGAPFERDRAAGHDNRRRTISPITSNAMRISPAIPSSDRPGRVARAAQRGATIAASPRKANARNRERGATDGRAAPSAQASGTCATPSAAFRQTRNSSSDTPGQFRRDIGALPRPGSSPPALRLRERRATFCEMYPSSAPMISEITPTTNGFSSEAEMTAPSLLPVRARPATAAYPSTPARNVAERRRLGCVDENEDRNEDTNPGPRRNAERAAERDMGDEAAAR